MGSRGACSKGPFPCMQRRTFCKKVGCLIFCHGHLLVIPTFSYLFYPLLALCLSVYLGIYQSINQSIHQSASLSIYQHDFFNLSIYQFVNLSGIESTHQPVNLHMFSICQSINLSYLPIYILSPISPGPRNSRTQASL